MAFYLRKLGRTFRLVPATKSLGYSTRISEGDKKDDGSFLQKHAEIVSGLQETSDPALPSSLVPLSVRDMSLVLMPRLEEQEQQERSCCHLTNMSEHLMSVAKTVSFTTDDILPASLYPLLTDKSLIMERIVLDVQHLGYTRSNELVFNDELLFQASHTPTTGANHRCMSSEEKFQTDPIFDKLFMHCNSQNPSLPSFSFYSSVQDSKEKSSKKKNAPSPDQLQSVKEKLERAVTMMFTSRYDYSLLDKDVVMENNLFGDNAVKVGPTAYALELLKLRLKIHTRFSSTTMEVMNSTVNEETGVIRIHWRLSGLPMTEMLKFWRVFQERDEISKDDYQWFEAFSYFHIGKDGLVRKHRIDRMLPGGNQPDKLQVRLRKMMNRAKPLIT